MKNKILLLLFLFESILLSAQNWQYFTPVSSTLDNPQPRWQRMSAVNADTAWFSDPYGMFTRTLDGGKTWQTGFVSSWEELVQEHYLGFFYAADANQAYAVWFHFNGESTLSMRTTDGGKTWNPAFPKGEFSEKGSFLNGIHFFNAQTALAWGDPVQGTFEVYRTVDGGNTWKKMQAPNALDGEICYFRAYDTYLDTIWMGTLSGRLLMSDNQGQTWSVAELPLPLDIGSIALNNGHEGALSVLGGGVWLSSDKGKTWIKGTVRSADGVLPNLIYNTKNQSNTYLSLNEQVGWADLSLDAGKTWGISILQPGLARLSDVKFFNPKAAWAIHNDSTVLRWTNPKVLFDPIEPDYTAVKNKHSNSVNPSGARVVLWSAPTGSYTIEHSLLKNGTTISTVKENLSLLPKQVYSSLSKPIFTGQGNYTLGTTLFNNANTIEQQHRMNLVVSDSVFAKDNGKSLVFSANNPGNFFDLLEKDTLTSITAKIFASESNKISFWVYSFYPPTGAYEKRLFYSDPIPLIDKDTTIVFEGDTISFPLPIEWVTYKLPTALPLEPGRYAIGIHFNRTGGVIQMDERKVSQQAVFRTLNRVDSIVGYAFTPIIRANFNYKNLIVSTKDHDLAVGIKVFPNPSSDWLSFELPYTLPERLGNNQSMSLRLFNLNGQKIHQQVISPGLSTVSINHFAKGVYLWQIRGNNGKIVAGTIIKN